MNKQEKFNKELWTWLKLESKVQDLRHERIISWLRHTRNLLMYFFYFSIAIVIFITILIITK
jgi:hypothetical protein